MGIKKIPFFDFSAVLDKLQAIADNVHPTASGTSITPTGMHIVTEDDVQGAISELDSAVDSVNASLTQLIRQTESTVTTNSSGRVQGTTEALFGVANATILEAYILREPSTLDVMRTAEISTYGSGGYTLTCTQTASKTALASQSLKIRFTYCVL